MSEEPLEFLQNNINNKVWIVSRNEVEYSGVLKGFDDSLNVVLSDMTVYGPENSKTTHTKALIRRDQIDLIIPNLEDGRLQK